jgi:hypothetical protein
MSSPKPHKRVLDPGPVYSPDRERARPAGGLATFHKIPAITLAALGVVGIFVSACDASSPSMFVRISGLCLLVAGAAASFGALLGFLFAVPRTVEATRGNRGTRTYRTNTNLEEISDWLTKILVGVGIAELTTTPRALRSAMTYLASSAGYADHAGTLILLVPIFATVGFYSVYLTTRVHLERTYASADVGIERVRSEVRPKAIATSRTLIDEADSLVSNGSYREAFGRYMQAYSLDSANLKALFCAAELSRERLKEPKGACMYYRMVLDQIPADIDSLFGLAVAEVMAGNTTDARDHLAKAIEIGGSAIQLRATRQELLKPLLLTIAKKRTPAETQAATDTTDTEGS